MHSSRAIEWALLRNKKTNGSGWPITSLLQRIPCLIPDNFLNPPKIDIKCFIALGFKRYPQNSLLIPCLEEQFANSGRNLTVSAVCFANILLFSLFFANFSCSSPALMRVGL